MRVITLPVLIMATVTSVLLYLAGSKEEKAEISLQKELTHYSEPLKLKEVKPKEESITSNPPNSSSDLTEREETDFPSHINLSNLPIGERKKKFVEIMLPLIQRANQEVLKERAFILQVANKKDLKPEEESKLKKLMEKYRTNDIKELLRRVNTVPEGLVLAQAAIESGWGTSRFFTEANNAFGMYNFKKRKCLKAKGAEVCLKIYKNLYESVKDYIYNLNVSWAYSDFRKLREEGADIYTLIESLSNYSERKNEYTKLLRKVVEKNDFDSLNPSLIASNSPSF